MGHFNPLCFILVLGVSSASSIEHKCFPDGRLEMVNPDPLKYLSAFAENGNSLCKAEWVDNSTRQRLKIQNCGKNTDIRVVFSTREETNFIYGGKTSKLFTIKCNDIWAQVYKTVRVQLTPIEFTIFQAGVTPSFTLTSRIYAAHDLLFLATNASIGQTLYWVLRGPEQYNLLPLTCTVYPGTDIAEAYTRYILVSSGCSLDTSLLSNFQAIGQELGKHDHHSDALLASLYVFRFHSNPFITIECKVLVCPRGQIACSYTCPVRRRRHAENVFNYSSLEFSHVIVQSRLFVHTEELTSKLNVNKSVWVKNTLWVTPFSLFMKAFNWLTQNWRL
ncbi:hypothetical protein ACJMK2_008245 [Sinanodonta woodiana]|uniref:ZP domain-containing protein n=1 Tax=Sinanodonta woodiana TaxID=1069815 RepID=A0ABD3VMK4_SINWO